MTPYEGFLRITCDEKYLTFKNLLEKDFCL